MTTILSAETEDVKDMGFARDIAETLHKHYPGHLWAVTVRGGVAIIKDLYISSLWGYLLKYADIVHDANVCKKEVIRAGGEILERAFLKRGERGDTKVTKVDGIADYKQMGDY